MYQLEHSFFCPYCNELISILLDPSVNKQQYIEDCQVCCNPIEIRYELENGELIAFQANSIEQ